MTLTDNQLKFLAIESAVKRASILPVIEGALTLTATIKYADPNPESDSSWHDSDLGDGRRLILVKDAAGRQIDAFYVIGEALSPCSPCPPCWWGTEDDGSGETCWDF